MRQLAGRLAGEIIFVPDEQATALLASGQVILPWERSTIQGGPEFEPEPIPEHLAKAKPIPEQRPAKPHRGAG